MGTRGYGYNQICVLIHIIMGSQIPVYYTRGYPFNYPPHARDGFYPRVPVDMGIFAIPTLTTNHQIHAQPNCRLIDYQPPIIDDLNPSPPMVPPPSSTPIIRSPEIPHIQPRWPIRPPPNC